VKSRIKKTDKTKPVYIYGKHALREALTQRPLSVQKIFLSPQFDDEQLLQVITKSRISVFTLKTKELENEVGSETSHQGVIALIDPGQLMVPFASFIESLDMRTNPGLVVFDEVHDPQNVGSVIRSAAAFGISAILFPEHNQAQITGSVVKVSAGMAFRIPLVSIGNVNQTVRTLKEKEYVVKDGEVIIVDEFTGRMQPGRRWSDGLHQAVEAKEGVKVEQESRTLASITFQNYFRFYEKLGGMTGTAETSKEEFYKVYGLVVTPIPTHNQIRRVDHPDFIFQSEKGKWQALTKKVKELHTKGQPVLIGTISIEKNEAISKYLEREGVPHAVLNAKNHEREGEIIAEAGKRGAVTIATNMAGRGVDIKLGGPQATDAEKEEVLALGGLFVIGTERHEARRIDKYKKLTE
jgi:hypothetical protein